MNKLKEFYFTKPDNRLRMNQIVDNLNMIHIYSQDKKLTLARFPKQAEIASGKLFFGLTCLTGKLTKYRVLSNIKQDYLKT